MERKRSLTNGNNQIDGIAYENWKLFTNVFDISTWHRHCIMESQTQELRHQTSTFTRQYFLGHIWIPYLKKLTTL